jgi:hypothetical protein
VLKILSSLIRHEKEIKVINLSRRNVSFLFNVNMIVYAEYLQEMTKPKTIGRNEYSNVTTFMIQNQLLSYITAMITEI